MLHKISWQLLETHKVATSYTFHVKATTQKLCSGYVTYRCLLIYKVLLSVWLQKIYVQLSQQYLKSNLIQIYNCPSSLDHPYYLFLPTSQYSKLLKRRCVFNVLSLASVSIVITLNATFALTYIYFVVIFLKVNARIHFRWCYW